MTKKEKYLSMLYITITIVLINLIISKTNLRVDLTRDKIYSLSKGTKEILKKIDDNMFVDLYYSKELPPQINSNKEYINAIVKDYSSYSNGNIKFSLIEITDKNKKVAIEEGITPVRFDIISREKFEQREGFLGLSIRYRNKKETIPFVSDVSNLEYDLSSRINNLIKDKKENIYFITDARSLSPYQIQPEIREVISSNYEIKSASLKELYQSTEPLSVVMIAPQEKMNDIDLYYLDQIIVRGSNLFLAYDRRYTSMESFFSRDNYTGIEKILEKNNITIKNTLIMDKNSQAIQIGFRQGIFLISNIVKYPFFIITTDLDRENPTTRDVYSLTIPFASPIDYSTSTTLSIKPLIKSSKYSWAKKENSYININPFQEYEISNDDLKGPFNIAVLVRGKFNSSFDTPPQIKEKGIKIEHIKTSTKESMLYLISSSKFIHQQNLNPENVQYFINIINYISTDKSLLGIRTKKAGFIPLKEINDYLKSLIKYANILLPVIIVLAYGIYRWKKLKLYTQKVIMEYGKKAYEKD